MSDQEMIAKGRHRAKLCSIAFGYTEKDVEQIVLGFEIDDDQDPDHGRFISSFRFFSENAIEYTFEDLKTLGWTGQRMDQLDAEHQAGRFGSGHVEIVVDHETYQDKTQARIKFINRTGGGQVRLKKPMDDGALKRLSDRIAQRAKTSTGRPPAKANGAPPANPTHPNAPGNRSAEDDIPF